MKISKFLFSLFLAFSTAISFNISADCAGGCCGDGGTSTDPKIVDTRQNDYPVVMNYVNSMRSIPLKDKTSVLTLSGDMRSGWGRLSERLNDLDLLANSIANTSASTPCSCINKDGKCSDRCVSKNAFLIEFNMYIDYACDKSWGVAWMQFANPAGMDTYVPCNLDKQSCRGSGSCENLCLRKAYVGYNVVANGCFRFDIELGRRPLWSVFNSYIQFNNRFDGALLRFAYRVQENSDLYLNGGPFVIDERAHHYGVVAETGYLNICNYRFDLLYSFISWSKSGPNRFGIKKALGNQFDNSQVTVNYWLFPEFLGTRVKLYAAGLVNTAAKASVKTLGKRANTGWYAGALIGTVCKAGDWSVDICYQRVEAQAVPDADISGIGNGNVLCEGFVGGATAIETRGRGNFQGWRFEGLYALSDNLSLDALVRFSDPINRNIGGKHPFSQFQIQAIFAF